MRKTNAVNEGRMADLITDVKSWDKMDHSLLNVRDINHKYTVGGIRT